MSIELPQRGTVPASGRCSWKKSKVALPASSRVIVDSPMAFSRPLWVCIERTTSSMPSKRLGGCRQHQIRTFGDDLEVIVGDEGGDLDDDVAAGVQAGHLEVHPRQHDRDLIARR